MQNAEEAADARLHSAFCILHSRQPRRRAMIRRFARPYARAINDVMKAGRRVTLEQAEVPAAAPVLAELRRFEDARQSANDLRELFANPGIDGGTKTSVA